MSSTMSSMLRISRTYGLPWTTKNLLTPVRRHASNDASIPSLPFKVTRDQAISAIQKHTAFPFRPPTSRPSPSKHYLPYHAFTITLTTTVQAEAGQTHRRVVRDLRGNITSQLYTIWNRLPRTKLPEETYSSSDTHCQIYANTSFHPRALVETATSPRDAVSAITTGRGETGVPRQPFTIPKEMAISRALSRLETLEKTRAEKYLRLSFPGADQIRIVGSAIEVFAINHRQLYMPAYMSSSSSASAPYMTFMNGFASNIPASGIRTVRPWVAAVTSGLLAATGSALLEAYENVAGFAVVTALFAALGASAARQFPRWEMAYYLNADRVEESRATQWSEVVGSWPDWRGARVGGGGGGRGRGESGYWWPWEEDADYGGYRKQSRGASSGGGAYGGYGQGGGGYGSTGGGGGYGSTDSSYGGFGQVNQDSEGLYKVLGLPKTATQAEIKKAYYALARKKHPDLVAAGKDEASKKKANEEFAKLNRAYEVLGSEEKRKRYERGERV